MNFLVIDTVSKHFGRVAALDAVSLDVAVGSRTAVVGPSGSGKSTLLRILAGFEAPDAGRVWLDGTLLAEGGSIVPAHLRSIGVVSQDGALFPHLTVEDNIGFGLDRRAPDRAQTIGSLIDLVELDRSMLSRPPHALSGGQQQRVALARALARRPRLMLLDEPFSALDTGLRETMCKTVAGVLERAGVAALLVTHDQREALSFADHVAVLREGRLVQYGTPRELYFTPADPATAAFLGEAIVLSAHLGDEVADCALGSVPVATHGRRGEARILLRPEQLRLLPVTASGASPARVIDVTFGGAACTVGLRLDGARGEDVTILRVQCPGFDAPVPGDLFEIAVEGRAHLF